MHKVPRHEIIVSEIVALEFHRKSMLMIQQDPGDEVIFSVDLTLTTFE